MCLRDTETSVIHLELNKQVEKIGGKGAKQNVKRGRDKKIRQDKMNYDKLRDEETEREVAERASMKPFEHI